MTPVAVAVAATTVNHHSYLYVLNDRLVYYVLSRRVPRSYSWRLECLEEVVVVEGFVALEEVIPVDVDAVDDVDVDGADPHLNLTLVPVPLVEEGEGA